MRHFQGVRPQTCFFSQKADTGTRVFRRRVRTEARVQHSLACGESEPRNKQEAAWEVYLLTTAQEDMNLCGFFEFIT